MMLYTRALGIYLGYPDCCIEAFLNNAPRNEPNPFFGTGYIPCDTCCKKDQIILKRLSAKPFPDCTGLHRLFEPYLKSDNYTPQQLAELIAGHNTPTIQVLDKNWSEIYHTKNGTNAGTEKLYRNLFNEKRLMSREIKASRLMQYNSGLSVKTTPKGLGFFFKPPCENIWNYCEVWSTGSAVFTANMNEVNASLKGKGPLKELQFADLKKALRGYPLTVIQTHGREVTQQIEALFQPTCA